jgi:hypothetical protein
MYTRDLFYVLHLSWGEQPAVVRLVLLSELALMIVSAVRFVKSARRLYRYSGERILPENVLRGDADPDLLAAAALATRALCKTVKARQSDSESSVDRAVAARALCILGAAESRYLYLWERCHSDVESARRASLLIFLLSLTVAAYAAPSAYFRCFNDSNLLGSTCLLLTLWYSLVLLAIQWSCCTVLYFASSFFERALAGRRTCWTYFCSRMRNELENR